MKKRETRNASYDRKANPPNPSGKGGFNDRPQDRNVSGQRNASAVAFARSLRELIVSEGETIDVDQREKKVALMVRQLWRAAIRGESWAVQFIAERVEGKVTQPLGQDPAMPFDSKLIAIVVHDDHPA